MAIRSMSLLEKKCKNCGAGITRQIDLSKRFIVGLITGGFWYLVAIRVKSFSALIVFSPVWIGIYAVLCCLLQKGEYIADKCSECGQSTSDKDVNLPDNERDLLDE